MPLSGALTARRLRSAACRAAGGGAAAAGDERRDERRRCHTRSGPRRRGRRGAGLGVAVAEALRRAAAGRQLARTAR